MSQKTFFFLSLFIFIILYQNSKSEKLIFAEIQFRHGVRSPISYNENFQDFFAEKWDNNGELTGKGQRMSFINGLKNHKRYITDLKFISEKYNPHEILAYSTPLNRTLMSIYSFLQGFYPYYEKKGENLTDYQLETCFPPGNITDEKILNEIKNLNESSLPNYISLPPVYMISKKDRRMPVYDSDGCSTFTNITRDKNKATMESIINITKFFNDKYAKKFNTFYNKENDSIYDFDWIGLMCDSLVSDLEEGRPLNEFKEKTGLKDEKLNELVEDCWKVITINFRDDFMGDEKHVLIKLDASKTFREMVHYMKLRVDADIKKENIDQNATDYSKPKMLIFCGHDTTLTSLNMFVITFFNLGVETFKYPKCSTQATFEVYRDDVEDTSKLNYENYNVRFFYNEEKKLDISLKDFIETVEKNVFSDKEIDEFCDAYLDNNDGNNEKKNNIYFYIIGGLSVVVFILVIVVIILCAKISKMKDDDLEGDKRLVSADD